MLAIDPTFPQEELHEKTGTTVPSQHRIHPGAGSSEEARRDRKTGREISCCPITGEENDKE
jgi:hypothetical protein